jgi:hypothetical protein
MKKEVVNIFRDKFILSGQKLLRKVGLYLQKMTKTKGQFPYQKRCLSSSKLFLKMHLNIYNGSDKQKIILYLHNKYKSPKQMSKFHSNSSPR